MQAVFSVLDGEGKWPRLLNLRKWMSMESLCNASWHVSLGNLDKERNNLPIQWGSRCLLMMTITIMTTYHPWNLW
jgi:hypothetical protein